MIDDFYTVTTPPSDTPISLTEAKAHCKIEVSDDDSLITSLIGAVTSMGELYTNRCFVQRTIECDFSGFDYSRLEAYPFVAIRRSPLITISSLQVIVDGSLEAFTDYAVKKMPSFSRLIFKNGTSGVSVDADVPLPWKVTFTAGYGASSSVPYDIKQALLAHVAFLYENRGDAVSDGKLRMPLETKAVYDGKYRIIHTF